MEQLKRKRESDGLTQADLARRLKISTNYLSRIERGAAEPSARLAESIAAYMGGAAAPAPQPLPPTSHPDEDAIVARLPGYVAAGDGVDVDARLDDEVAVPVAVLSRPDRPHWAVRVKGDSMTGDGLQPDDIVAYTDMPYHTGVMVIAHVEGRGYLVKRYRRAHGTVYLMSSNPQVATIEVPAGHCVVKGVVVAHHSRALGHWRAIA